jgi:hypothetical protein
MRVAAVVHGDGRECRRADQGCRPACEGGVLVIAAQSLGENVTSGAAGGAEDRDPHRSLPLRADGSVEARPARPPQHDGQHHRQQREQGDQQHPVDRMPLAPGGVPVQE